MRIDSEIIRFGRTAHQLDSARRDAGRGQGPKKRRRAVRLRYVEPQSLEARVAALETQVRELAERVRASEQDAAAARVLAGAADRDVAEFGDEIRDFRQATVASFNALREDFGDLRTNVERGFIEMRGKLDAAAAGQQRIVELIEGLIADQGENGPLGHR